MSKLATFIGSLAKLAGMEQADRVDRQNMLVFHDEIKGHTVFDRKGKHDNRSLVIFRGFPDTKKTLYLKSLVTLLELRHYQSEGRASDEEISAADTLEKILVVEQQEYPDVAEVMAVEDVAVVALNWI